MNKDLKDIFENFEPEANDAHTAARWELLKPHLPQKRRPGIILWWQRTGNKTALVAMLVLALAVFQLSRQSRQPQIAEKKTAAPAGANLPPSRPLHPVTPIPKQNPSGVTPHQPESSGSQPQQSSSAAAVSVFSKKRLTETSIIGAAPLSSPNQNKSAAGTHEGGNPASDTALHHAEYLTPHTLAHSQQESQINPAITVTKLHPRRLPGIVTLDLFAGPVQYNYGVNSTRQSNIAYLSNSAFDKSYKTNFRGITAMAGAGLRLKLWRRLFLPVQFTYIGPQKLAEEKETYYTRNSAGVLQNVEQVNRVSCAHSLRAGAGLGLQIIAGPSFSLSATAVMQYARDRYTLRHEFNYTDATQPSNAIPPQLRAVPNFSDATLFGVYWSARAGLIYAHRLNRLLSLTLRPEIQSDLSHRKVNFKQPLDLLKGRHLSVTAGVAYRFRSR